MNLGDLRVTELTRRTWREVSEDKVTGRAAELAYYSEVDKTLGKYRVEKEFPNTGNAA